MMLGDDRWLLRFASQFVKQESIKKDLYLMLNHNGYKDFFSLNHEHFLSLMNMT